MRRVPLSITACAFFLAATAAIAFAPAQASARERRADVARVQERVLARIHRHRQETWRLERLMGKRPTPTAGSARRSRALAYRRWVLGLWQRRARRARAQAARPPRKAAWLCIRRYEATWHDSSPPYYGGLQMDWAFMRAYGGELLRRKGTADRWTPHEQMWVADRDYRSGRRFSPWPNTARFCGLS